MTRYYVSILKISSDSDCELTAFELLFSALPNTILMETTEMKSLFAFCAAAGLMMITSTASAHFSPEDLAARCANEVNGIVDRCQEAAADETTECVRTIRRLLADGRERAARRVAADCIADATARTEKCTHRVNRITNACIDELLNMGASVLARRLDNARDNAIEELRKILQREKHAIRNALNG